MALRVSLMHIQIKHQHNQSECPEHNILHKASHNTTKKSHSPGARGAVCAPGEQVLHMLQRAAAPCALRDQMLHVQLCST